MKIYMKAYLAENLGDDLFVKIITERYKNHKFYSISDGFSNYKNNPNFSNLKVITKHRIFKNIRKYKLEKLIAKFMDVALTSGGSMFMEQNKNDYKKEFLLKKKNQYILGSNFGPYKTQKYFDTLKNAFSKAEDVCFREKYSYDFFKDLENVRYAQDIVFNLDISNIKITNNRRAIISVIDCENKIDKKYGEKYENTIIELAEYLVKNDYKVCLMSFCKYEKDEDAINRILEKMDKKGIDNIEHYFYNGDIKEALNNIGNSSLVVGSRFHAIILGLLLNKTVMPIIYSDKTKHIIEENNIKAKMIEIKNIDEFNVSDITEIDLTQKNDISKLKIEAEKQFEKLDMILK